jgi:hypothetical protein
MHAPGSSEIADFFWQIANRLVALSVGNTDFIFRDPKDLHRAPACAGDFFLCKKSKPVTFFLLPDENCRKPLF